MEACDTYPLCITWSGNTTIRIYILFRLQERCDDYMSENFRPKKRYGEFERQMWPMRNRFRPTMRTVSRGTYFTILTMETKANRK